MAVTGSRTYLADIEAAQQFLPQNKFREQLEQYRSLSKPPELDQVEVNRPGPDIQGFYNRLALTKNVSNVMGAVEAQKLANRNAMAALVQAQNQYAVNQQGYDLSGVTPQYTKGGKVGSPYGIPLRNYTRISSGFGPRSSQNGRIGSNHTGIDFAARAGTPIYATHSGYVRTAGWSGNYGNLVVLTGGSGLSTYYAHQSRMAVRPNQYVQKGQIIGYVGSTGRSTGNHLHYEVRVNGVPVNPARYY